MAVEQDDLVFNPFYQALQGQFCNKYEYAQDHCYLVCIPQSASMVGVEITPKFVETHILKPSPMFQDNYISTDRLGSKTVVLDGHEIILVEGFDNPSKVKIISEELCYNKKYKPYKMLIIESPIVGEVKGRRGSAGLSDEFLKPRTTFVENVKFLNLFPECRFQLLNLDKSIQQFNHNYLMVKGYLEAASQKLRKIWQENLEALIKANNYVSLQSDSRLEEALALATESYLMGGVHSKIFKAVCDECQRQDRLLATKAGQLQGITGKQLGVKDDFVCPLPSSESITEEVSQHLKADMVPGFTSNCLTSDDLIPLLVLVISGAKCHHLASNLMYIESFHWVSSKSDNLGYSLVTFKAAIEYMLATDFTPLASSEHRVKKEMSIDELMAASSFSDGLAADGADRPHSKELTGITQSLHRELDNISKMMEESMNVQQDASKNGFQQREKDAIQPPKQLPEVATKTSSKQAKSSQLGDFLLALQNDVLESSYGKQD
ncbi:putative ankyrin repeat domain-containing protein 27 [Apostichopus japonicus]|uniref:Putative ankyrin repeat domain-containing protein 27 n=1 Tax=Stichopus japonicus TaxID=307972 RepID=A0A2G8JRN2_STIJA|nr:putative ankyrin repeat domain-containing protein 27 [Apostichopus japonicus]